MVYTQILKVLHRKLQHTTTRLSVQTCRLGQISGVMHTNRTMSAVSGLVFTRGAEAPSPALSYFVQARWRRAFSLDSTARNKSGSEEGGKAVSRYQIGSPKLSAQKVKEAGRDFTYLIVVLVGFGVTGALLYVVFQELFSSQSPNKIYGKAYDKVRLNSEVIGAFGEPLKCYGETTRRGRRQQVSHMEYLKDGLKHMRLKFYIEGSEPGLKGIVHSESKESPETGKYEFHYIVVELDTYPRRTIVVEDNRSNLF